MSDYAEDTGLIAILAAGLGSRFGGGKLDAPCAGRRLGEWAVATALGFEWPVAVVAGPGERRFLAPFAGRIGVIENASPSAGIGSSVALAAGAAREAGASALIVMLADMPLLQPGSIRKLAQLASVHGLSATAWPVGRNGVPACFGASHFDALATLSGDMGAQALLRSCSEDALLRLDAEQLSDVDTAADLASVADLLAARQDRR